MPVRAILQPSDGIWRKLRSATKQPRSSVRELICASDKISVCAIERANFEAEWAPIQTGVKSRKRGGLTQSLFRAGVKCEFSFSKRGMVSGADPLHFRFMVIFLHPIRR